MRLVFDFDGVDADDALCRADGGSWNELEELDELELESLEAGRLRFVFFFFIFPALFFPVVFSSLPLLLRLASSCAL